MIIHYVGDIHQPLHTTTQYSKKNPKGDRGGNYQKMIKRYGVTNLHFLWDSVIYKFANGPSKCPLSDSSLLWLNGEAAKLAMEFPVDPDRVHTGNFKLWAEEGFNLAASFAYPGFIEKEELSEEYKARALKVVSK